MKRLERGVRHREVEKGGEDDEVFERAYLGLLT